MTARPLMIQGTSSDAGKSLMVTGLCRLLMRAGVRVAPFKPQNMALNSAVTVDGGEIGRAQALQALACGLEPVIDMNPVLLKPVTDAGSQVIINGKAQGNMRATEYHDYKTTARKAALAAYERLANTFDVIIIEGAGSPAEINLRKNDFANMGFAEAVDAPVWLVADIERGGVFAQITGTLALLAPPERERVKGIVINRFRGDLSILQPGVDWLVEREGIPVLGVAPYIKELKLDAEDSLNIKSGGGAGGAEPFRIVIPALPRMSNHTDFDPLLARPDVSVVFTKDGKFPAADLVILPGSKSVRSDCDWLKERGYDQAIQKVLRYGGKVLGLCGGYQMLGEMMHDPDGVEGRPGSTRGLGLLAMETTLAKDKRLANVAGNLVLDNAPVTGYEIHAGITSGPALERPLVRLEGRTDGAFSADGAVAGCYLHGLFEQSEAASALLAWAGLKNPASVANHGAHREREIDRVADMMGAELDLSSLETLCGVPLAGRGAV